MKDIAHVKMYFDDKVVFDSKATLLDNTDKGSNTLVKVPFYFDTPLKVHRIEIFLYEKLVYYFNYPVGKDMPITDATTELTLGFSLPRNSLSYILD